MVLDGNLGVHENQPGVHLVNGAETRSVHKFFLRHILRYPRNHLRNSESVAWDEIIEKEKDDCVGVCAQCKGERMARYKCLANFF